jgi:hypothetical protein
MTVKTSWQKPKLNVLKDPHLQGEGIEAQVESIEVIQSGNAECPLYGKCNGLDFAVKKGCADLGLIKDNYCNDPEKYHDCGLGQESARMLAGFGKKSIGKTLSSEPKHTPDDGYGLE